MFQKLKSSLITSIILYAIAFGLVWYNDNFEEALALTKEYWWFIVLLPVFLMIYAWFKDVKKKAFEMGARTKKYNNGKTIN